jgi:hypothetical protein
MHGMKGIPSIAFKENGMDDRTILTEAFDLQCAMRAEMAENGP